MSAYQYKEPFDCDDYLNWLIEGERLSNATPLTTEDLIPAACLEPRPVELELSQAQGIPLDPVLPPGTVAIGATPATPDYQVGARFRIKLDPQEYLKLQALPLPPPAPLPSEAPIQCGGYHWGDFCPHAWMAINAMAQKAEAQQKASILRRLEEEKARVRMTEELILNFKPEGKAN